jgi:hypothetical protein
MRNKSHLEDWTQLHNFPQNGRICVYQIGRKDCDGVRILTHVDRKAIDQNGDDCPSSRTGQNQVDKLVGEWRITTYLLEDLATMQERVTQHAHVFLSAKGGYIQKTDGKLSEQKFRGEGGNIPISIIISSRH